MKRLLVALVLAGCGGSDSSGPAPRAAGGGFVRAFPSLTFDQPVFLAAAPGNASLLYVATQPGRVHVFDGSASTPTASVFLELAVRQSNEEGLLGLAFHPQFAYNGWFYVYYSPAGEPRRTRISRFGITDRLHADAASEQVLLEIGQPFPNHKGGVLAFGPDEMLYAGIGDGGSSNDPQNRAQDLSSLLGKVLRLAPDGSIPPGNPFAGTAGARGEIWAYGLRNPWRFSFDGTTLWAGDVGQNAVEEIDHIVAGGNYGWRAREGTRDNPAVPDPAPSGAIAPVHEYGHEGDRCSVTGGYVYRGSAVPSRIGQYFFADFCSAEVWALQDGTAEGVGSVPNPSSFGVDAAGELYITSLEGGLYRLQQ